MIKDEVVLNVDNNIDVREFLYDGDDHVVYED